MKSVRQMSIVVAAIMVIQIGCKPPGGSASATGSSNSSSPAAGAPVSSANDIINRLADFYKAANAAEVDIVETLPIPLPNVQATRTVKLSVQRPDKLAVRDTSGTTVDVITDGKSLYTVIAPVKKYIEAPAVGNLDQLAQNPTPLALAGWGVMFSPALFCSDPYKAINENVQSVEYVGKESVDKVEAHRLKFVQANFTWEMWVAATGDPVVLKLEIDSPAGAKAAFGVVGKTSATFKNWKVQKELPPETFAFKPAEGFEKIAGGDASSMAGVLGGLAGGLSGLPNGIPGLPGNEPAEPPSPLVGTAAPDVEGKLLNGKNFSLKSEYANKVVMLDFWATWCGPCVAELPLLINVADQFADKGVAFYAVNVGEGQEEIATFLQEKKWKMNVVLDPPGAFAEKYKVEGIPQLVIIDKEGKIRRVHIGFDPGIEAKLSKELNEILSGSKDGG